MRSVSEMPYCRGNVKSDGIAKTKDEDEYFVSYFCVLDLQWEKGQLFVDRKSEKENSSSLTTYANRTALSQNPCAVIIVCSVLVVG